MSYENIPKNLTEKSALVRQGKPDYTKLEAAAFPVPAPTLDEAGTILENSDTGTRYRWTGTAWKQIDIPKDYFVEAAEGNIAGTTMVQATGRNFTIGSSTFQTIWDQGGNYTYLTADTELFISSSDALDTAVTCLITGLDDTYTEVTRIVVTNGQSQVAVVGDMFRVHAVLVISSTSPVGDLYLAETDTLTAGVPDTASKIKAKVALAPGETGIYASTNASHNGFFTVPAGKTARTLVLFASAPRNDDVQIDVRVRPFGGSFISIGTNFIYQSVASLDILARAAVGEKADLEVRAIAASGANNKIEINFEFVMIDN